MFISKDMDMNVHSCVSHKSQNMEIEVQQWMKMWYAGWNTILFRKGQPTLLTHSTLSPHGPGQFYTHSHLKPGETDGSGWASLSCPFCHTRLFQRLSSVLPWLVSMPLLDTSHNPALGPQYHLKLLPWWLRCVAVSYVFSMRLSLTTFYRT